MAPTTDLNVLRANAENLLWHASRLAGLAEDVERRNGRSFTDPVTWIQAAKADLQELGLADARILRESLPYAVAAIPVGLRDAALRTSHVCGLLASAARAGCEAVEPVATKSRTMAQPYPDTVKMTRALPAMLRRAGARAVELTGIDGHALAEAQAAHPRNAAAAQRMRRDAAIPVRADGEMSPGAADQLQLVLTQLADERAPYFNISGLPLLGIEHPLPTDQGRTAAVLIAVDLEREPNRATIVRTTHAADGKHVGRVLTGDDNDLVAGWVSVGVRVYAARAGHEYEAYATCSTHPWGRTREVTQQTDPITGRIVSTVYGGDSDYAWAERYERTGKGARPSNAAMKAFRAVNACPICALPHGPQITTKSRVEVDAYHRLRRSAREQYFRQTAAWPGQKGQTSNERLLVKRDGDETSTYLGVLPEPVLQGALYHVVEDLQTDYVVRGETLWRATTDKVPANREQMALKWGWIAKKLGPRPLDRFTVALERHVEHEVDGPYCVGELEREVESAIAQATIDIAHLQRA